MVVVCTVTRCSPNRVVVKVAELAVVVVCFAKRYDQDGAVVKVARPVVVVVSIAERYSHSGVVKKVKTGCVVVVACFAERYSHDGIVVMVEVRTNDVRQSPSSDRPQIQAGPQWPVLKEQRPDLSPK